jgi:hypothetical protein
MAGQAAVPRLFALLAAAKILGAVHLFGRCSIRDSRPGRGAACPVGPDLAFALQLLQDEPDRLVADAWHCRPDVGEAEDHERVAQDVLSDALLLRPRTPGRGQACRARYTR